MDGDGDYIYPFFGIENVEVEGANIGTAHGADGEIRNSLEKGTRERNERVGPARPLRDDRLGCGQIWVRDI